MNKSQPYLFIILCSFFLFQACNEPDYQLSDAPRTPSKSLKRGVSYDFQLYPDEEMALLAPGVCWFYNWGSTLSSSVNHSAGFYDYSYFPMAWNDVNADALRTYKAAHPECNYLLAYNEPNLTDQGNMTPKQAAAKWPRLLAVAKELNMKIVSPAMNYGTLPGYSDPIVWLDEFFTLVNPDDISAIAIHCYMANASALKSYVERFKKYNKPIWMTEFCAYEQSVSSPLVQMKYMSEAVCYMELDPDIERYAWFIPKGGKAVTDYPYMYLIDKIYPFNLTDCGKVFVNMTTADKKVYAIANQQIEVEHFTNCNLSESINKSGFSVPVHFRPTTDENGGLDIYDFTENKWVEYQIELKEKRQYQLKIRNFSPLNTEMTISLDGKVAAFVSLPESDSWDTLTVPLDFPSGKHTIRLQVNDGNTCLNWLTFN